MWYVQETRLSASSLCGRRPRLCWSAITFPRFGHGNTHLRPNGYIRGQAHDRLILLEPTSFISNSCRHVKNLQEINCCLQQCDSATTSNTYASISSPAVSNAELEHCWGYFHENCPPKYQNKHRQHVCPRILFRQMSSLTLNVFHDG